MSGGSRVTTQTTEPWDAQKGYLKQGFKQASDIYAKGPADYYSGPTLAGFTPAETAAQKGIAGYVTGPRAAGQQSYAEGALTRGLSGEVDLKKFNPMMDALSNQMKSQLTGSVLPGIRQSLVEYQPGGSTRGDLVQSQAISAANKQMLDKAAEMYGGAYQGAQDRAIQWGSQYPSIMNAPLSTYGALGGIGEQQRGMQQEAINRDMARYQYEATKPQTQLANYMSMISGDYGGTTTQVAPGPSGLQQMASLAGAVAPFLPVSDIRMKRNIIPEGTSWKGLDVYTYNYLGQSTRRRGVMAQDVEKIYPDAVVEIGGVKRVDYGAI
jgi:hypothetical protein